MQGRSSVLPVRAPPSEVRFARCSVNIPSGIRWYITPKVASEGGVRTGQHFLGLRDSRRRKLNRAEFSVQTEVELCLSASSVPFAHDAETQATLTSVTVSTSQKCHPLTATVEPRPFFPSPDASLRTLFEGCRPVNSFGNSCAPDAKTDF